MQPGRFTRNALRTGVGAIAVVAGSALLTLVGCALVGHQLTGVSLHRGVPSTCIKQCSDLYKALFDEERKRHLINVEICRNLPHPERGACLDAEGARHAAETQRLSQSLTDCQNSCHDGGGGTGG